MAGPSTYSPNLKIQLMQTGDKTGQWGAITNINLGNVLEQALTYQSVVAVADIVTPTDLTSVEGTSVGDTARSLYIKLTGALTATRTVRTIAVNHFYVVENATTGGFGINFISQAVGSTGVTIPAGATAMLYCDGTNVVTTISYIASLQTAITGGSINNTPIGGTTPSSGVFTSGSAQTWNITTGGTLNGVTITNATASFTGITASNVTINSGTINGTDIGSLVPSTGNFTTLTSTGGALNGTIGALTRYSGAFTTLASTGVYTNTVTDGTAPMTISSTTRVNNLNVARSGYSDTSTVADDNTTNSTFFPLFSAAVSGQNALKGASTKWTFNPNTGAMTIAGAFTASSLTPVNPVGTAYGGTGNNKGVLNPRVTSVASATSITPNADTTDIVIQANTGVAGTLTIAAPTGTPVDGQKLIIRVTCTNAQVLSFNAAYRSSTDLGFPASTTGSSKTDYMGFIYNSAALKWDLLAKVFGF